MQRLLHYPFADRSRAEREIHALAPLLPESAQNFLSLLLAASPAPEQALHYFTRLRESQPEAFQHFAEGPAGLKALVTIFAYSRFLSEEILEHPAWLRELIGSRALDRPLRHEQLRRRLIATLPPGVPPPLLLARFRRRHILRILIRDVLGLGTLPEITGELTALADTILDVAYERIYQDLVEHYGVPQAEDDREPAHLAVIALGKMGGQELNYSSDIDLMFLYSANGQTSGANPLTNKEFFKRAANRLTALLSTYTAEGLCYRVDLRLRPDGSLGEVCMSLEGAKHYYSERARDWELQMLIKARVAAGHPATGRTLLDFVEPRIYSSTLDFSAVEQLSATRERINEKLAGEKLAGRNGSTHAHPQAETIDVKLSPGGIRDIEFLVQCLQRLHGGADRWIRHSGTLLALGRLHDKKQISDAEYGKLASAYSFLRAVEHRLQFDEDRQTHSLPPDTASQELLARRLPGGQSASWLAQEVHRHFEQVREIYERVVHSRSPESLPSYANRQASNVVLALEQRARTLAAELAHADLHRGFHPFEHFLERLAGSSVSLDRLDRDPELARVTLDLFEHSPYLAEELIRTPDLIEEVAQCHVPLTQSVAAPRDANELRRWYRREIMRIGADSIGVSRPIFESLARTSDLADAVIARTYEIALEEVRESHLLPDGYDPDHCMWVIALGRLGMREFDLASDADLVFVLADSDAAQMRFWTRVANRMIELITAYTGAGVLFAVDTRLRPNGNAGPIVQTEAAVQEYFETSAEAWEGLAYMKSRAVAGDYQRANAFLADIQRVDWRRYGQSGRSRADLKQMRMRVEREQGVSYPLKAGRGGYYDIDFLLLYLRLKSAGVYYTVLTTPQRIEVVEQMGQLSHREAQFLQEAATFYRAIDHGVRLISGHAEGRLPKSDAQIEMLSALVKRWTPVPLTDLDRIQSETRGLFERYFG